LSKFVFSELFACGDKLLRIKMVLYSGVHFFISCTFFFVVARGNSNIHLRISQAVMMMMMMMMMYEIYCPGDK